MAPGLCWGPSEIDSTVPLEDEQLVASSSSSSILPSNSQSLLPSPSLSSISLPTASSSSSTSSSSCLKSKSVRMPLLALGTLHLSGKDLRRSIRTAILDYGYRHLDCATSHGNEAQIGDILEELFQEKRISRNELFITSKLWNNAHGPPNSGRVLSSCLKTLRDLKLTFLDCYLIHYPVAFVTGVPIGSDPTSPGQIDWNLTANLQETWASMEELVEKGLVRTIGVSNFEIQHLEQILNPSLSASPFSSSPSSSFVLRIRPRVNQIETHPYLQCSELIDYCHRHSIAVMAYSPLGSPSNPWTSRQNLGLPSLLQDSSVEDIAERLGKTPSQILIRWALQRGNESGAFMGAIVKSSEPDHIKSNAEVFDFRLSPEDMRELNSRNRGTRFNHPITPWLGRGSFPRNLVAVAAEEGRREERIQPTLVVATAGGR